MQTLSFRQLRRELRAAGAAPSVIDRITLELGEHCQDAEDAALARGASAEEARREACAALGSSAAIVAAVASQPNLLDWRHRWPYSARCVDSIAACLAWPVAPFVYCMSHQAMIVRWGVSSSLAACVTAMLLLAMQLLTVGWPI